MRRVQEIYVPVLLIKGRRRHSLLLLVFVFVLFLLTTLLQPPSSLLFVSGYNILIIGGTRFSGAALWSELYKRGGGGDGGQEQQHSITLYNRGKTPPKKLCHESDSDFQLRIQNTKYIKGDRKDPNAIQSLIDPTLYDYVYDMNARESSDVKPIAELFVGSTNLKQYILMSSAGVYMKSDEMPHIETDPVDIQSRHKGKLDSENLLHSLGVPYCSFRPTYICGPDNYNPIERYFFERIDNNRPICIPGHGQHMTGFGHVYDLAIAMSNCIHREHITTGKCYNVQNTQAITFDGVARIAAKVMGKQQQDVPIVHYDPKDYIFPQNKKAFPMRPQHFYTDIKRAMIDLDWIPQYNTAELIFKDSYENDYIHVKASGQLKNDFECDDIILSQQQ